MEIESVGPSAWVMAGLVVGMAVAGLLVVVLSWRFLKSAAMLVIALGMLGGLGVVMYAVVLEEPVDIEGWRGKLESGIERLKEVVLEIRESDGEAGEREFFGPRMPSGNFVAKRVSRLGGSPEKRVKESWNGRQGPGQVVRERHGAFA